MAQCAFLLPQVHINLSKFQFLSCSYPYFLPSVTKAKLQVRRNQLFLTSVLIYLHVVSAAGSTYSTYSPLLWALSKTQTSWLFRCGCIHLFTEQRCIVFVLHIQRERSCNGSGQAFIRSLCSFRATLPIFIGCGLHISRLLVRHVLMW